MPIDRIAEGDAVFSPRLAGFVLDAFRAGEPVGADVELETLTPREREVLQLIARGYRYKEIAARLHLSVKTVEAHVSSVLRKLQLSSRHELTRWAQERRLIDRYDRGMRNVSAIALVAISITACGLAFSTSVSAHSGATGCRVFADVPRATAAQAAHPQLFAWAEVYCSDRTRDSVRVFAIDIGPVGEAVVSPRSPCGACSRASWPLQATGRSSGRVPTTAPSARST